ncbi:hypothetical protein B0H13DRAFT_1886307 [Mycena leptocephala]|nr:hypothetical protein B0H13DRAFT_1886307 [Mycena leptocephala]
MPRARIERATPALDNIPPQLILAYADHPPPKLFKALRTLNIFACSGVGTSGSFWNQLGNGTCRRLPKEKEKKKDDTHCVWLGLESNEGSLLKARIMILISAGQLLFEAGKWIRRSKEMKKNVPLAKYCGRGPTGYTKAKKTRWLTKYASGSNRTSDLCATWMGRCELLQMRTIRHRGFSNHCQLKIYWQLSLKRGSGLWMQVLVHLDFDFLS